MDVLYSGMAGVSSEAIILTRPSRRAMRRRSTTVTIALAGSVAVLIAPGSAQAATPAFTCEASALRGTVLGTAIEPVVFGRGQECKTGEAVPTLNVPELLEAKALIAAGNRNADAAKPAAGAVGGLVGTRLKLLPSVPIPLPTDQILANIQAVPVIGLPGLVTVDIREALRALIPLPQADLLSAGVLSSVATASCDGTATAPKFAGASLITGLSVLGKPIDLDTPLQQNINLFDTASIKPSDIDISKLSATGPLGVNVPLTQALQDQLRPILAALPPIAIPPALAQVKLSTKEQTKDATSLTQRALRVQVSLLSQSLLDVVVGEAKVSATGDCPVAAAAPEPAELQCTDRKLVLLDVFKEKGRVRLRGAANRDFVGKTIDIKYRASGNKVVARAKVAQNGSFETTAAMPPARVRDTNASRYTAVRGSERSLPLKLIRRLRTSSVTSSGGFVTIRGRVSRPLAAPTQEIRLIRRIACGKAQLIKRFKPKRDGSFTVRVKATDRPAVYRATTRVRKVVTNPKTYPTFTLPRGIDLNKR
jgi:hypothetical protein